MNEAEELHKMFENDWSMIPKFWLVNFIMGRDNYKKLCEGVYLCGARVGGKITFERDRQVIDRLLKSVDR